MNKHRLWQHILPILWATFILHTIDIHNSFAEDGQQNQPTEKPTQTSDINEHPCIDVREANIANSAWQRLLSELKQSSGRFTVLRVTQQHPTPKAPIMAKALILKQFKNNALSGGGTFCEAQSGEFIVWDHLKPPTPKDPQATMLIGHPASGTLDLIVDIPDSGQIKCYDVHFKVCPKNMRGNLLVALSRPANVRCSRFTLGMVTIGGIYGIDYTWNAQRSSVPIQLAPGRYKILFPDINPVKGRFDFTIAPNETTTLKFTATSQKEIVLQ